MRGSLILILAVVATWAGSAGAQDRAHAPKPAKAAPKPAKAAPKPAKVAAAAVRKARPNPSVRLVCGFGGVERRHPRGAAVDIERMRFDHWAVPYRGRLGVVVATLTRQRRVALGAPPTAGLYVKRVVPGSAAAAAGVKRGDVLTDVAGKTAQKGADIRAALKQADVGDLMTLQVIRERTPTTLTTTLVNPRKPAADGRLRFTSDGPEVPRVGADLVARAQRIRKLRKLAAQLRR